ncbi:MAM and LDL-receptor class A domain-containing protein 1-like isoform X2 [Tachypleus tridentatus]|uniref:MAM and LDL-receptor class A domain-containing protein 1-like isoform X2 n=1 Tax=Tachypleus tridentatus TaxID=6853 RepID=UPI003FD23E32
MNFRSYFLLNPKVLFSVTFTQIAVYFKCMDGQTVFGPDIGDTFSHHECSFTNASTFDLDPCIFQLNEAEEMFGVYTWKLNSGKNALWSGGPTVDGTNSFEGGYAFVDLSVIGDEPKNLSDKAWLSSALLTPSNAEGKCLTFQYSMKGLNVLGLRVLLYDDFNQNTYSLWEKSDTTQGRWEDGKATFSSDHFYRIIFEALPRSQELDRRGYAAVDSITMTNGPCQGDCSFEKDFCSFENVDRGDDFDWSLDRGSTSTITGPKRDHGSTITRGRIGSYAYISSSFPRKPGDRAQLWSSTLTVPGDSVGKCLQFWTSLYGIGIGALRIFLFDNSTGSIGSAIWELTTGTLAADRWYKGEITLSNPSPFKAVFEAEIRRPGQGDIALDDIIFIDGPCPSVPREASQKGDCAFMVDLCDWIENDFKHRPDSAVLWQRTVGDGTPLKPFGHSPLIEDSSTFNAYLKFETNNFEHAPLDRGILISPNIQTSNLTQCLSMWAYMFSATPGEPVGSLMIKLRQQNQNTTAMWRLNNHQNSRWFYVQVPFSADVNTQVLIEAIKGGNARAVIAVDDITFTTPPSCPVLPPEAETHKGDCSFDTDMCMWTVVNSPQQTRKWSLPNDQNRPAVVRDHTFEASGGFLFFDVFSSRTPVTSEIESVKLASNSSWCFTFWYTTSGSEIGAELKVAIKNDAITDVWKHVRTQYAGTMATPPYTFAQVEVSSTVDFTVILSATVKESGFVVDDIKFYSTLTSCPVRPKEAEI